MDKFYGYEDYNLTTFSNVLFKDAAYYAGRFSTYYQGRETEIIMPIDSSLLNEHGYYIPDINNHPELLKTAKKIYTHPSCKVPRDAIKKKYKKCLNPWEADAVIISDINYSYFPVSNYVVFVNHKVKRVYISYLSDIANYFNRVMNAPGGCSPESLVVAPHDSYDTYFKESKLEYVGPVCKFEKKDAAILDCLTYKIPKDKIVFQRDLLRTLGDETNAPTLEALVSIYEMLRSNDESVNEMGLKTLATLDYAHYPETFIAMLKLVDIRWNDARNASAVKCMLDTLGLKGGSALSWIKHTHKFVSRKDYEMFEQMIKAIYKGGFENYCEGISFMYLDNYLTPRPRYID